MFPLLLFTSRIVTVSSSAPNFNSIVAVIGEDFSDPIVIALTVSRELILLINLLDLRGATDSAIGKSAFLVA